MAADTLYEDDIVAWAEQQALAIRRLARTRPDLSNVLDWENLAEEIESLGRNETRAFTGPLRQFLIHLAKALSSSRSQPLARWRIECQTFHFKAVEAFAPSMRQKVDLAAIWRTARKEAALSLEAYDERLASDLEGECPLTFEELLGPDLDLDEAMAIASVRLGRTGRPKSLFPGA